MNGMWGSVRENRFIPRHPKRRLSRKERPCTLAGDARWIDVVAVQFSPEKSATARERCPFMHREVECFGEKRGAPLYREIAPRRGSATGRRWNQTYRDNHMPESQIDFSCRVCGKQCDTAPMPPLHAVCEEHCEDHEYEYDPDERWHLCKHCNKRVDEDWYYCDDDVI